MTKKNMQRRRGPNFTYVSGCVKYMIFVLNFVFWLLGGLLIAIGLYAFLDKWQATGLIKLDTVYDVMLNISLLLALLGAVVFVVSFAGCVGALRENTCLLKFYSLCLLILFLVEMGGAVCGFAFPRSLHGFLEIGFTERVLHAYRDDPDLQNFIDFAQSDFHCCGLTSDGYMDWSKNEYFNCSSPSVERCGVPFSCCINATDIASGLVNIMCGYGAQNYPVAEASKRVWTSGCIEIVRSWMERNLYTIASVALGVALSQLFVIYLAKTLEGQIELQKSRWQT
ncbi:tetraspanin-33-like [Cydia strobilella]|uniref:tetraspanin-33-like n=2 Tax=Grapholitini TaxID=581387 RepID=UPI003007295A